MFSSSPRNDPSGSGPIRRALKVLILGAICAGWAAGAHAQVDVKKAIVKIVTSGMKIENGVRVVPDEYVGSGFIVYSKEARGEAETVIVTADHVLGYTLSKAHDPNNITFTAGEIANAPPVWVNQDHEMCLEKLRVWGEKPEPSKPCRRIEIFYLDKGQWIPYNTEIYIHWQGDKNRDAAVLRLKFAHNDERGLEIGSGFSSTEASQRAQSIPLPPFMAWGIESRQPEKDPFATYLTYRWRNDGPTLLFQTPVEPGNSGGPIIFEGKVIGIVSGVQSGETRGTNISTVYDPLRSWDILSVRRADRMSSSQLLRQIRCETRFSLRRILIEWLGALGNQGSPVAQELALQYQSDPDSISTFNYQVFKGPEYSMVREAVKLFYSAGIAYAFETNPRFTATDTFDRLLTNFNQPIRGIRYCDGVITAVDYDRTGVDRVIRDFMQLSLFGNLANMSDREPPTMVDVLTYTPSAGRTDTHIVTVALAISTAANSGVVRGQNAVVVGNRLTGRGSSPSELLALMAIDQVKHRPAQ
jgi:hypothetical protein